MAARIGAEIHGRRRSCNTKLTGIKDVSIAFFHRVRWQTVEVLIQVSKLPSAILKFPIHGQSCVTSVDCNNAHAHACYFVLKIKITGKCDQRSVMHTVKIAQLVVCKTI